MRRTSADEVEVSLTVFLHILMGYLGTPNQSWHSASLRCLTCLLYYFRDEPEVAAVLADLLPQVYQLMAGNSREVVKTCLDLTRTVVRILDADRIAAELPELLPALFRWSGDSKNRFRQKVRTIVVFLVRKVGQQRVAEFIPESDRPLLHAILKKERKKIKLAARDDAGRDGSDRQAGRGGGARDGRRLRDGDGDGDDPTDLMDMSSVSRGLVRGKGRQGRFGPKDEIEDFEDDDNDVSHVEEGEGGGTGGVVESWCGSSCPPTG